MLLGLVKSVRIYFNGLVSFILSSISFFRSTACIKIAILLLIKYKIVIIDEVQRVANAGLLLKILVDNFKDVQFIATGSSALDISEQIFEPLTGRYLLFHLYPFAQAEIYPTKTVFELEQQLPFHLRFGAYPDIVLNRADAEIIAM